MTRYYSDTDPMMEALQIRLLRATPPWKKIEMLVEMNKAAKTEIEPPSVKFAKELAAPGPVQSP